MIDWNYVLTAVIIILLVSIVITIVKKAFKVLLSVIILIILLTGFSAFLVYKDLKTFDSTQTFVLEKDNKSVAVVDNGKLLDTVPDKFSKRVFVFDADTFKEISDDYNLKMFLDDKLKGSDKEDQKFILENAKSVPETPAYKLKPITNLILGK